MRTVVRFRTGTDRWAVPVERAREVRDAAGLRSLPTPRAGVAGVLDRDGDVLPVLSLLGPGARQVLVLDADPAYAVLVDEVTGVERVAETSFGPAPRGQDLDVVAATIHEGDDVTLVLDVDALATRAIA